MAFRNKIVLEIAVETGENKKKQISKLSENKENSQTRPKDVFRVTKRWINSKNLKKHEKNFKNIVDRKVVLRYNVTRWR